MFVIALLGLVVKLIELKHT
ncbi:hypothetical protein [Stakelama saccharophila]